MATFDFSDLTDKLTEGVTGVLSSIGKDQGKKIFQSIFSSSKDEFKDVVLKVARRLDKRHDAELLGGNMPEWITQPGCLDLFKRYLIPFDEPSEREFREFLDLNTLPTDFLPTFKKELFSELFKNETFRDRLVAVFNSLKIEGITRELGVVNRLNHSINEHTELSAKKGVQN